MIQEYVNNFINNRERLRSEWQGRDLSAEELAREAIYAAFTDEDGCIVDEVRAVMLGGYQGDYVFVCQEGLDIYTAVVAYGSCPGCDAVEAANSVEDYLTIALHVVQSIQRIN